MIADIHFFPFKVTNRHCSGCKISFKLTQLRTCSHIDHFAPDPFSAAAWKENSICSLLPSWGGCMPEIEIYPEYCTEIRLAKALGQNLGHCTSEHQLAPDWSWKLPADGGNSWREPNHARHWFLENLFRIHMQTIQVSQISVKVLDW